MDVIGFWKYVAHCDILSSVPYYLRKFTLVAHFIHLRKVRHQRDIMTTKDPTTKDPPPTVQLHPINCYFVTQNPEKCKDPRNKKLFVPTLHLSSLLYTPSIICFSLHVDFYIIYLEMKILGSVSMIRSVAGIWALSALQPAIRK